MSKSYKLLGNMGSQYGGFKGSSKSPEFDIDTRKHQAGWMCVMYRGHEKICETKYCATQKLAEEAIALLLHELPSDKRPDDLNTVVWNSVVDSTSYGTNSGSYSVSSSVYTHCDHDPDEMKDDKLKNSPFSIGKVAIIGATKSKILSLSSKRKKRRLIVNCSGSSISSAAYSPKPIEKPFVSVAKQFETFFLQNYAWQMPESKPKLFYGDEVVVDWPDQKSAPLHPRFWVDLLALIQTDDFQAKYADVVFCCFGGHGRTGTALASLAICAGIYAEKGVTFKSDPKRIPTAAEKAEVWIQHDYCKKAIESDDQTEYLACVDEYIVSPSMKTGE